MLHAFVKPLASYTSPHTTMVWGWWISWRGCRVHDHAMLRLARLTSDRQSPAPQPLRNGGRFWFDPFATQLYVQSGGLCLALRWLCNTQVVSGALSAGKEVQHATVRDARKIYIGGHEEHQ